jgi:hypothetical protein
MKGFIKKTLAALTLAGGLSMSTGCYSSVQEKYHGCVDPCWPQRYSAMASDSVTSAFAAQVENGHILDQTVWIDHFDRGTAVLAAAGRMHLDYIARRRPSPDPRIFLQTAYDIAYDPANPGKFAADRAQLDQERVAAIYAYLQAQTAGRPVSFNVQIHDPGPVGMHAVPMLKTVSSWHGNFQGFLPTTAGGAGIATGGPP